MAGKPTDVNAAPVSDTDPKGADISAATMTRITQYSNAYNEASKNKNQPEMERIQKEWFQYSFQTYVLGEGPKVLAEMAKLSPDLVKSLATAIQQSGVDALTKMLEAQSEANKKKQEMYRDEIDKMYQARLSTADGPAKMMASFKGFAMLLQAMLGIDCTEFIAECDKRIDAEYARVPKKDIEGLSTINAYTVDPRKASQIARAMGDDAQTLASTAPEKARKGNNAALGETAPMVGVGKTSAAPASAPSTQPVAAIKPVSTALVIDSMVALIEDKGLITTDKGRAGLKAELQKGITAAASVDGDAKTISTKDLGALALNTGDAIKAQGGPNIDAKTATGLAQRAIERARGMELADAGPSPRPS